MPAFALERKRAGREREITREKKGEGRRACAESGLIIIELSECRLMILITLPSRLPKRDRDRGERITEHRDGDGGSRVIKFRSVNVCFISMYRAYRRVRVLRRLYTANLNLRPDNSLVR